MFDIKKKVLVTISDISNSTIVLLHAKSNGIYIVFDFFLALCLTFKVKKGTHFDALDFPVSGSGCMCLKMQRVLYVLTLPY